MYQANSFRHALICPKNVIGTLRSSEAGRRGRRPLPRLSPFSAKPKRRPHFGGEGYSRGAKTDPFSLRARQAGASRKPQGFCFMFAQDGSPRASTPTMRPRRASFFSLHHWGRGTAPAVEGVRLIHYAICKDNRRILCEEHRQGNPNHNRKP